MWNFSQYVTSNVTIFDYILINLCITVLKFILIKTVFNRIGDIMNLLCLFWSVIISILISILLRTFFLYSPSFLLFIHKFSTPFDKHWHTKVYSVTASQNKGTPSNKKIHIQALLYAHIWISYAFFMLLFSVQDSAILNIR